MSVATKFSPYDLEFSGVKKVEATSIKHKPQSQVAILESTETITSNGLRGNGHETCKSVSETILPSYTQHKSRNTFLELPEYAGQTLNRTHSNASHREILPDYDDHDDIYNTASTLRSTQYLHPRGSVTNTESILNIIGIQDVCGNKKLWKMLVAEFIGTLFLIFIGCGTCISGWSTTYEPSMVQIALGFGVAVATMAQVRMILAPV